MPPPRIVPILGRSAALVIAAALLGCSGAGPAEPPALALIGSDGQGYIATAQAAPQPLLPAPEAVTAYRWPSWSADGRRLMLSGSRLAADRSTVGIVTFIDRPAADTQTLVLADAPIYGAWSPRSDRVALLLPSPDAAGVELFIASRGEAGWQLSDTGLRGRSLYFAWSPDGKQLAIRRAAERTSRVELFTLASGRIELLGTAGDFHSPAWLSGGGIVAGWRDEAGASTIGAHPLDGEVTTLGALDGRSAFVPANRSDSIAYAVSARPSGFLYQDLTVVTAAGESRLLVDGSLLAFFWSPDDRFIAYVTLARADGLLHWHTVELATGRIQDLGGFEPTQDQFIYFQYFDQYAASSDIWSPDGSALVSAGRFPNHGQGIFLLHVREPGLERIGGGRIAVWPRAIP